MTEGLHSDDLLAAKGEARQALTAALFEAGRAPTPYEQMCSSYDEHFLFSTLNPEYDVWCAGAGVLIRLDGVFRFVDDEWAA